MRRFTLVTLILLLIAIGAAAAYQNWWAKARRPSVPTPVQVVPLDPLENLP
ncbi:MAG TPA: hypothetical protein VNO34_05980 [Actinomycetota bacterium]|nr:hypothetical protein [Actinomycetota bacterium]